MKKLIIVGASGFGREVAQWVEDINDDDGSDHVEGKTYGIKHQVHGIYEAFTFTDNSYTEIIININ